MNPWSQWFERCSRAHPALLVLATFAMAALALALILLQRDPTVILYVTLGIPAVNLYHRLGFVEAGPTYIEAERMLTR